MKFILMTPLMKQSIRYPISGLAYLASFTADIATCTEIFIPKNHEIDEDAFAKKLEQYKPDFVGINIFSMTFSGARHTIDVIKNYDENIVVVLGGPHPSGEPQGTLRDLERADFSFQGEAEIGLRKFIEVFKENKDNLKDAALLSTIPGLCFRSGDTIVANTPEFVADINTLPLPDYNLMSPDDFFSATGSGYQKAKRIGHITSSRGCARRCAFCSGHTVSGKKVRLRDPQKVVDEIKLLMNDYKIQEIQFTDSDIAFSKKHLYALCEAIIENNIKIHWSCAACSDSLEAELIALMKKSGCYMVRLGIETASPRILKLIHKKVDLDKLKDNIKVLRKCGIRTHGFFIIGFHTENMDDIKMTIDYSHQSDLDSASFAIFQPLPGSELYTCYVTAEVRESLNWDNFDFYRDSHFTYNVPFEKLKSIQRRAYIQFYLYPRRFFSLLTYLMSFSAIKTFFKIMKRNLSGGS
ncbi:B12-binding domain-containing radical SAM protein [bacterium]|nr:B12-binding domain-containing radical SAM protein [bacterium]